MNLSDLTAAPYNPRTISAGALFGLGYSMDEFGDLSGIVWNSRTGSLVCGHQRVRSLSEKHGDLEVLDGEIRAPNGNVFSVRVVDWPLDKEKAANVAANATTIQGVFTSDLLDLMLGIESSMPDVFGGLDFGGMVDALDFGLVNKTKAAEQAAAQDGASGTVAAKVDSVYGRVYQLGPHRILCGDCRDEDQLQALLGSDLARIAITSPPYAKQREYDEDSEYEPVPASKYGRWWSDVQSAVRSSLLPDGSFFVNIKEHCRDGQRVLYVRKLVVRMVEEWGWSFVDEFVWEHVAAVGSWPNRFKNGWEPVFHFAVDKVGVFRPAAVGHKSDAVNVRRGSTKNTSSPLSDYYRCPVDLESGIAYPNNIIKCTGVEPNTGHVAAYPVGLPSFFIRAFTESGDFVFDPFLGSGTTLIAAAEHGRGCLGTEISPRYCDDIRRRWARWAMRNDVDPGENALGGA